MIRRRALAAGIEIKIGRNTFRATGITAYLDDRRLEIAQQMGAHESALTTGHCAPPHRGFVQVGISDRWSFGVDAEFP